MKKITKLLLGGALVMLLLAPASQVKADWHQDNVGWWYSLNNGSYIKGRIAHIDGKLYKFDERGYMVTGWHKEDYDYRDARGALEKRWSYFDPVSGAKVQGWQKIDGKWYYLIATGPITGEHNIGGKEYYFDPANGDMKTGWVSKIGDSGTEWYYYDPVSGARAEGWQKIDGKWYYFFPHALKGFQKIDGKSYYFDPANGDMKTGWVSWIGLSGTEWYYYDLESGEQLSGWQTIDGKTYYFDHFGEASIGLVMFLDGKTYNFNQFGLPTVATQVKLLDGKTYYFDPDNCDLKTGWLDLLGRRYYADPNDGGAFASNKTLVIDGVSYTFGIDGSVINNEP